MNTKISSKSILKPASLFGLLMLASLVLAACAGATSSTSKGPGAYGNNSGASATSPSLPTTASTVAATAVSNPPSASGEATINVVNDPKLGQILVDGKGMTLYVFDKDTTDKSNCNAGCLALWPPLLTQGKPTLGTGIDQSLIGTTQTTDGRTMVTYNHRPLYYYAKDTQPGDTNGQGVGSVWFVIAPDGTEITK